MTPLFKKLNFKDHIQILVLNSPESFETELLEMISLTKIEKDVNEVKEIGFAIIFVNTQAQIDDYIDIVFPKLEGDAVLWFCYPKSSSKKYRCEFNRDTGWSSLGKYNLEGVRQVAIDEDWSALRFRKIEYIKTLTRREDFALSEEGKKRTKKKSD